ncbi:MAG: hypothetical protein KatS3mg129_2068 [Leptospiraceae bacterium]|nr:MAG: hypothetical protein KatS3mg129_2068 [Leptospiraceae bacterium]
MNFKLKKLMLINILFLISCNSYQIIQNNPIIESYIYLTDQKIQFTLPSNWLFYYSSKKYFQFVAKNPNNLYGPILEYRGLNNTTQTQKERDLYAEGWYKAIELNFPEWEYKEKGYKEFNYNNNKIYTYHFIGTFLDGKVKMKKLGYLRFYKDKVHAIYYTTRDDNFNQFFELFKEIDQKIIYEPYIPPY